MIREVISGSTVAVLLILAWQGINVMPLLLLGCMSLLIYRYGDIKSLGKSFTVAKQDKKTSLVCFDMIGGQQTAKKELQEALDFICHPERVAQMGIRPLKGILLTGPPGTGKTLLAKAAAAYTDSAFVSVAGSEFIEMYAGVGAQRVRKLFESARSLALHEKKQSAIVFIDEIEIIGGRRGANTSHHEYDQTLNQMLVEMDGMQSASQVKTLVIGATNRSDMLDSALLRPGRFDRIVKVDLPDMSGRMEILNLHLKNKPIDEDVAIDSLARETFGFSGAHLESLTNEAAILAMREGASTIMRHHLSEAVDKVIMGEKLERKPAKEELWRVAVHEAGHALISEALRPGSVSAVTIAPRGDTLGYVRNTPEKDSYLYTLDYLESQISILMGGAVAEKLLLGTLSTGATGDFSQAVETAKKIISSGLSELKVVSLENLPKAMLHRAMSKIIRKQERRAQAILMSNKAQLQEIADLLLKEEKLTGDLLRGFLPSKVSSA